MKIQQCRLFFQAATTSETKKSERSCREHACSCVAAAILAALLIGCTSLTPERVNVLASIAGQAAALGASEWLTAHPEHRPAFSNAVVELGAVLKTDNKAPQALEDAAVEFLNKLETQTLRGKDGEVYVTGDAGDGQLVVWDAQLKKGVQVRGAAAEPVVRKIYAGLRKALVPKPPMPPLAKRTGGLVPEAGGIVPEAAPGEPVDTFVTPAGMLEIAASTSPKLTRVYSVTERVGEAVSVRWKMTPGFVYHVEHSMATNGPWVQAFSLTNRTANVVTNWMAPSGSVGTYRVMRSK